MSSEPLDDTILRHAKLLYPDDAALCHRVTATLLQREKKEDLEAAVASRHKILAMIVKASEEQHDAERDVDVLGELAAIKKQLTEMTKQAAQSGPAETSPVNDQLTNPKDHTKEIAARLGRLEERMDAMTEHILRVMDQMKELQQGIMAMSEKARSHTTTATTTTTTAATAAAATDISDTITAGDMAECPKACADFKARKAMTVFKYGAWYLAFPDGKDPLYLSDPATHRTMEIVFGSNGWFRTDGSQGGMIHWTAGNTSEQSLYHMDVVKHIGKHYRGAAKNTLGKSANLVVNDWSICFERGGIRIRYKSGSDIFLTADGSRVTYKGMNVVF